MKRPWLATAMVFYVLSTPTSLLARPNSLLIIADGMPATGAPLIFVIPQPPDTGAIFYRTVSP